MPKNSVQGEELACSQQGSFRENPEERRMHRSPKRSSPDWATIITRHFHAQIHLSLCVIENSTPPSWPRSQIRVSQSRQNLSILHNRTIPQEYPSTRRNTLLTERNTPTTMPPKGGTGGETVDMVPQGQAVRFLLRACLMSPLSRAF